MSRWLIALELILTLLYLAGWVLALMGLLGRSGTPVAALVRMIVALPSCPCWR